MSPSAWPSCPACGSQNTSVLHESDPEAKRTDATLRCEDCSQVFKDTLSREDPEADVACVISEGAESRSTTISLPKEEKIHVEDELYAEGHRLRVTSIERDDGDRSKSATPDELGTLWCKVFDQVEVPVSVNQGRKTWAGEVNARPDEEFFVGDQLTLEDLEVELHSIKTETGVLRDGSARARDIVRLYGETAYRETEEDNW